MAKAPPASTGASIVRTGPFCAGGRLMRLFNVVRTVPALSRVRQAHRHEGRENNIADDGERVHVGPFKAGALEGLSGASVPRLDRGGKGYLT
jgi:hypothetical protein